MFDFGFGELLLLAIIALVVLGPERLPIAARLLGRWIRAARSQWNSVKAELENEIADEELRRNLREASDAMRDGAQQMRAMGENPIEPSHEAAAAAAAPSESTRAGAGVTDEPAQLSLLAQDPSTDAPADRMHSDG
jgi:sec-independent protein translocase protein TatB